MEGAVQAVPPMAILPWANHLIILSTETPSVKEGEKTTTISFSI